MHDLEFEHLHVDPGDGAVNEVAWAADNVELITVGILLALGREREAAGHIGGALNVGVTREELVELLIHCTAYAGFPTMVTGSARPRPLPSGNSDATV